MIFKNVGNARDEVLLVIKNGDTAAIPKGTPVVIAATSTVATNAADDGLAVVLPSTAGALRTLMLAYGVSTAASLAVNYVDYAKGFGYSPYNLLVIATRAASTVSWNSNASVAAYQYLTIDTVNNAFAAGGTTNVPEAIPFAVLLDTVASFASSASTVTDTRTAITVAVRSYLHFL